jgi:hypothetical protein
MAADESALNQELIPRSTRERMSYPRAKLDTIPRVRSEMGRIYNQVKTGRLDPGEGRGLIWMLAEVKKTLEAEEKLRLAREMGGLGNGEAEQSVSLPATVAILEDLVRSAEKVSTAPAGQDGSLLPPALPAKQA